MVAVSLAAAEQAQEQEQEQLGADDNNLVNTTTQIRRFKSLRTTLALVSLVLYLLRHINLAGRRTLPTPGSSTRAPLRFLLVLDGERRCRPPSQVVVPPPLRNRFRSSSSHLPL
jgi:hypothetical protein